MSLKRLPALLFPGQGSQKKAMLQPFLDMFPHIVKPILEETDEALNQRFSRLLIKNTDAESMLPDINLTSNAQPAILITSYTVFEILKTQLSISSNTDKNSFLKNNFSCTLGHSLGEFSASTAAGALQFFDSVNLVHQRGKAMEESKELFLNKYKHLNGGNEIELGMYVVLFPKDIANSVMKIFDEKIRCSVSKGQDATADKSFLSKDNGVADLHPLVSFVELGIINSSSQIVFSGPKDAVKSVLSYLQAELMAKRSFKTIPLNVSAPFHSPIMEHARNKMKDIIDNLHSKNRINFDAIDVNKGIPLVSNITALPFSSESQYLRSLVYSCTDRVYWYKSIVEYVCNDQQVSKLISLAPGNVTDLTKKDVDPKTVSLINVDENTLEDVLRNW